MLVNRLQNKAHVFPRTMEQPGSINYLEGGTFIVPESQDCKVEDGLWLHPSGLHCACITASHGQKAAAVALIVTEWMAFSFG